MRRACLRGARTRQPRRRRDRRSAGSPPCTPLSLQPSAHRRRAARQVLGCYTDKAWWTFLLVGPPNSTRAYGAIATRPAQQAVLVVLLPAAHRPLLPAARRPACAWAAAHLAAGGHPAACAVQPPCPPPAPCPQIPAYAAYMLMVHVVLPWWNTPKLDDMPETGGCRSYQLRNCMRWAARTKKWCTRWAAARQAARRRRRQRKAGGRSLPAAAAAGVASAAMPSKLLYLLAARLQMRSASGGRRGSGRKLAQPSSAGDARVARGERAPCGSSAAAFSMRDAFAVRPCCTFFQACNEDQAACGRLARD